MVLYAHKRMHHKEAVELKEKKKKTNKDLLYSIGNCPQYSVMTYMGKVFKKVWIYGMYK